MKAERLKLDVIVMDLLMPALNGLDATHALRAAGNRVPVVAIRFLHPGADAVEPVRALADGQPVVPIAVG